MPLALKISVLFLCLAICHVNSARILGIFHLPSKSHHIIGSALLKTLSKRGHDVTMISPFPFKTKIANYRDISVEETLNFKDGASGMASLTDANKTSLGRVFSSAQMFEDIIELVLNNKEVQELKNEHFDLVIPFGIYSYSFLGLAHHFKAPVILFSTVGSTAVTDEYIGNPSPISYVPTMLLGASAEMNFLQRVTNTILSFAMDVMTYMVKRGQRKQIQRHFPDAPSLEDMMQNVSLVFVNSHYSIESPRPSVPNQIQVGGIHMDKAGKLPEHLQTFLDDAKDGALFFCMGSNVKISNMDRDKLQAIMAVLGGLEQKVLFKSEVDVPFAPENVHIEKWMPQSDILAHPNVKAFISHGGLGSTTEAVYRGVPILGIPMFGDQQMNIALAVEAGYAVELRFSDVNVETFSAALKEILFNDKYRKNVELKSSLLRDQPIKPMDNAVFWVEHVIKYKGARHLQNAGVKLYWFQYMLIDVLVFIVAVLSASVWFIYFVLKKIVVGVFRLVRRPKVKTQ